MRATLLIEASWHYRHARRGQKLRKRREGQPGWVIALADRAQARLHRKRFWRLVLHGKAHNKAVTAVARELAGFIWAALREHGAAKGSGASVGG